MSVQQHLEELHDWFSRSISSAYRQAWSVEEPAGVAPEWREICTSFEVTPISDEEREQVRRAQRPHRGAAVMEVAQVISAIVDQAKVSLGHVDPTGVSPELASVHDKLRRLIERTEREVVEAHRFGQLLNADIRLEIAHLHGEVVGVHLAAQD